MKKKKLIYLSIVALVLGIAGLISYYCLRENSKTYFEEKATEFKSIQLFEDNKFVLVAVEAKKNRGKIYYGQNYISTLEVHSLETEETETSPPIGKEEYYKIISYDLNSSNLSKKELNLYESPIVQSENLRLNQVLGSYYGDGKDYLTEELYSYEDGKYFGKNFLLDIDSGQFFFKDVVERRNAMAMNAPRWKAISLSPGNLSDSFNNQLAKYHLWELDGYITPEIRNEIDYSNQIDISDTNFAQLYPEVAKNMKDMTQLYFRPEQYNQKEWFDNLLHWFAPKGQDVMEVYATDSATGEKTQIKSFDDYLAWREAHPEEVKKYEQ